MDDGAKNFSAHIGIFSFLSKLCFWRAARVNELFIDQVQSAYYLLISLKLQWKFFDPCPRQ